MTAGTVRKPEAESRERDAGDSGWNPLEEHLSAPHGAILFDDREFFVFHGLLRVSSVPRPPAHPPAKRRKGAEER
jgi:hypothetical protein